MKTAWALGVLFIMLSCGSWFTPPTAEPQVVGVAASEKPPECPRQQVVLDLIADLESCEKHVVECGADVKATGQQQQQGAQAREKVVVVEKKRKCADEGPHLIPVITTKCADGQLCLDEQAQLAYAKNQIAYESWVKRVQECEAK